MRMSPREVTLGLVTSAVVLFGVTALVVKPRYEDWKDIRNKQALIRRKIERDSRLVDQEAEWRRRLQDVSKSLPRYPRDERVEAHWLSVISEMSGQHNLQLSKRGDLREEVHGDVYELRIQYTQWEGDLDALVHFLFDLQSRGGMLDVRYLTVKPNTKGGRTLTGQCWLSCAYTRGESAEPTKPPETG